MESGMVIIRARAPSMSETDVFTAVNGPNVPCPRSTVSWMLSGAVKGVSAEGLAKARASLPLTSQPRSLGEPEASVLVARRILQESLPPMNRESIRYPSVVLWKTRVPCPGAAPGTAPSSAGPEFQTPTHLGWTTVP